MLKAGAVLGSRYEIIGRIGSGGMADVYKAKDNKLNRFVAVKVMKSEFKNDSNFVARFTREAQAAAGLANPNIVNVFDVGDDNGVYYIVMELVEGITLKEYIGKKGRLSVREATSIAIQVCMGLAAAHAHGIIHRDVKPQNIIISTDGKVKVTDFGIARAASSNTISANAMGSVHYSSPEQVRGGFADAKSDIYSLGITMYEMVAGRVPFDGDSTVAIAIKHLQDEMDPPSKYAEDLPYSLEQIIYKCTQKSAERRYNSVDEVIEDLKHSLIDPNGHFVQLTPLTTHAQTIMMSPAEMAAIKAGTAERKPEDAHRPESREVYDSTSAARRSTETRPRKAYDSVDDDDDIEDYRTARRRSSSKSRRDDDDDDDDEMTGGLEKALTIGGFIVGVLIICILIYFIGRAAGIFRFGAGSSSESAVSSIESSVEESVPSADLIPVPSIVGLTEQEAQTVLTNLGLGIKYQGEEHSDTLAAGLIVRQEPQAGSQVEANTTIYYYRSAGAAAKPIPNVVGLNLSDAQSELNANGFTNITITQASHETAAINTVIGISPDAGQSVDTATPITLTVSTGPAPQPETPVNPPVEGTMVVVESWTGLSQEVATQLAQAKGLTVSIAYGTGNTCEYGEVLSQSLESGTEVPAGSNIVLTINSPDGTAAGIQSDPQQPAEPGNPAAVGTWSCSQRLGAPSNYTGGPYRLTLEQNVNGSKQEKTIAEGVSIAFPYELKTSGAAGVSTGKVHLYEQVNGSFIIRANWEVPFSES